MNSPFLIFLLNVFPIGGAQATLADSVQVMHLELLCWRLRFLLLAWLSELVEEEEDREEEEEEEEMAEDNEDALPA